MTSILGVLAHAVRGEIEVAAIAANLGEHDPSTIIKALRRFERQGIDTHRAWKLMKMWRLAEAWPAYPQLRSLLLQMGEVWPEYREAAAVEALLYTPNRAARQRGRTRLER